MKNIYIGDDQNVLISHELRKISIAKFVYSYFLCVSIVLEGYYKGGGKKKN